MKKLILTFALMTALLSTYAQGNMTFDLGVKGSINSTKITTDNATVEGYTFDDFKSDAKMGYNLGLFARLGGERIYLQPELLYCVRKGENDFSSPTGGASNQTFKLKTIQVPVLLGFNLIDLRLVSIHAFTGPAMSFILNSSDIESNLPKFDPNNFKNNIWDWQLGAGVDMGPIVFDIRYEWALTDYSDGNFSPSKIGFVNKGNVLTFSLGLKFM